MYLHGGFIHLKKMRSQSRSEFVGNEGDETRHKFVGGKRCAFFFQQSQIWTHHRRGHDSNSFFAMFATTFL
jgi:hypothetical protein